MAGNVINYGATGFDSGKDFANLASQHLLSAAQQGSSQAHEMVKKLYDHLSQVKMMQAGINPFTGAMDPSAYAGAQAPLKDMRSRLDQQMRYSSPNMYANGENYDDPGTYRNPAMNQYKPPQGQQPQQPRQWPEWYHNQWRQQNPGTPDAYYQQDQNQYQQHMQQQNPQPNGNTQFNPNAMRRAPR